MNMAAATATRMGRRNTQLRTHWSVSLDTQQSVIRRIPTTIGALSGLVDESFFQIGDHPGIWKGVTHEKKKNTTKRKERRCLSRDDVLIWSK
jgi:hypothetical protein